MSQLGLLQLLCELLILCDGSRCGGLCDTEASLASSASEQWRNLEKVAELPLVSHKCLTPKVTSESCVANSWFCPPRHDKVKPVCSARLHWGFHSELKGSYAIDVFFNYLKVASSFLPPLQGRIMAKLGPSRSIGGERKSPASEL